nr:hypothetical protein [Nitrosomonas nitrosa]
MEALNTYKRGQVEEALWSHFAPNTPSGAPPAKLRTRIKRLIDIDRDTAKINKGATSSLAFNDGGGGGPGVDTYYTAFDAFCLALGLELLDAGFKQSEVVFLLQHERARLRREYGRMRDEGVGTNELLSPKDHPALPIHKYKDAHYADPRVFMVTAKVEMVEVFETFAKQRKNKAPVMFEPIYCHGIAALSDTLSDLCESQRKAFVLELTQTAIGVTALLEKTEPTRRGPK